MSDNSSKEIRSTLTNEGILELSIVNVERPVPGDDEVLLKIEASPINPSDLALLITFAADLDSLSVSGEGDQTVASIKLHPGLLGALKPRMGQSMQVGNEGGGVVIDAGANAKHLIGKTVGVAGGAMYSQYRCVPAQSCLVMNEGTTSMQAASSFVNPLTALAFVETMRLENHTALLNTAAASNLGQMLVKICKDDGVPLINVVRKPEQVETLKKLGAESVSYTHLTLPTKRIV